MGIQYTLLKGLGLSPSMMNPRTVATKVRQAHSTTAHHSGHGRDRRQDIPQAGASGNGRWDFGALRMSSMVV